MRNRMLVLAAFLLALAAVVLSASSSLGRSKSDQRATEARYPMALASATKRSGLKVRYELADGTLQPGGADGFSIKCPRKAPHPIGGFGGPGEQGAVGKLDFAPLS